MNCITNFNISLIHILFFFEGPYGINRVPLRRVNQAYVIATQTKVDVSSVNLPARLNDEYFKRESLVAKKGGKKQSIFYKDAVSIFDLF